MKIDLFDKILISTLKNLENIDLSSVIEIMDNTNLSGEIACGADGCVVEGV